MIILLLIAMRCVDSFALDVLQDFFPVDVGRLSVDA